MNRDLTEIIENVADSLGHGMVFLSEDKKICDCSQKAKEIMGMILPLGKNHRSGKLEEGDIIIIADNEIGDDDMLAPEDLAYINICDKNIKIGDAVLAIGVYKNKKIQPVYKFFDKYSSEKKVSLTQIYMGFNISISIDYSQNTITAEVNGTEYSMNFLESVGYMIAIDGSSGEIKFFQTNGYGFRGEEIGNLLRGKNFAAKGQSENTQNLSIIGEDFEKVFQGKEFITAVKNIFEGMDKDCTSGIFQIYKRIMYCHIIRIKKGKQSDGVCILIQDNDLMSNYLSSGNALANEVEKRKKRKDGNLTTLNEKNFEHFIGSDPEMDVVKQLAYKASKTKFNVIITGESGTGKSRLAREIHDMYNPKAPFVEVTCNAIAPTLFESELFGYAQGAFTGAASGGRAGYFEEADGGTIFLDEIGEIPPEIQVKLLHVLQNKKIYRVGSTKPINVDVRVITATNKNLEDEVSKGNFRRDLYYRINVFPIRIPALRERKRDIYVLANSILENLCSRYNMEQKQFSGEALEIMFGYDWPGNVRELENIIERAVTLCDGKLIYQEHLTLGNKSNLCLSLKDRIEQEELRIIKETLYRNNYDKKKTMEELGMSKTAFYEKIKKIK